ncbi:hypothetical protein EOA46_08480 [Mesorhizobium sp. M1A.F.Ca.IN.022.05.2.1]|uniref:hypothetical protein n=1 Tax=unclassified Mesorhizobium TaxID=325217 RepID=UPI000FC9BD5C|nr:MULTISPECIES: hypothetical protein [unclassified Mesorhizobium]RUV90259.1 hypothetical protein EOA51_00645 [Mesorhizobium sp. M1A.F.Ca.IN.020.32.1.1]RUW12734.1 hypothetical protein EOA46_08480 [Mesorhizobium sp. M1A.F.Ca.IN.022.05.2.1]RWF82264.1 MAG: hypothetical protein EOQ35_10880 [Mesorhizobium sp.]RWG04185.1 MAG: hypothetical protein EOQ38_06495 [Mesorhizobium sp.]RWG91980.1 MAG: hypothetical protein EOQ68_04640 [Mesorhizobium sp.]
MRRVKKRTAMRPSVKLFNEIPFAAPKKVVASRVVTADERQADRKREPRAVDKLKALDGGKDGAKVTTVKLRISGKRNDLQAIRSRPGTFEWRYGRKRQDALFHAGSHLAILWERAGIAVASSADFLRGTSSGYATEISDSRVAAMDKLDGFVKEMGRAPAARLIDYCVSGLTTAQIAMKHGATDREMAPVLHHDLRACAQHFKFLARGRH